MPAADLRSPRRGQACPLQPAQDCRIICKEIPQFTLDHCCRVEEIQRGVIGDEARLPYKLV